MQKLELAEGEEVLLRNTRLAKANFVKLEPLNSQWMEVPEPLRRSILEHELSRHFQSLTVGDVITIHYDDHRFQMKIVGKLLTENDCFSNDYTLLSYYSDSLS